MNRPRRLTASICVGVLVLGALLLSVGAAHAEVQLRAAFNKTVFQIDQRSAQTPDGVVVFDSNGNSILVYGAGGDPQQAPGVG